MQFDVMSANSSYNSLLGDNIVCLTLLQLEKKLSKRLTSIFHFYVLFQNSFGKEERKVAILIGGSCDNSNKLI